MKMEVFPAFEVRDALPKIDAAAPDDAVDVVAFVEQETPTGTSHPAR